MSKIRMSVVIAIALCMQSQELLTAAQSNRYLQPPELQAAVESRRFANARIVWIVDDAKNGRNHECVSTYTSGEAMFTRKWDDPDNPHPADGSTNREMNILFSDNKIWLTSGSSLMARVDEDKHDAGTRKMYDDARFIGLIPVGWGSEEEIWYGSKYPRVYDTTEDGELLLVTATERHHDEELEHKWWIDPAKGWSVMRQQTVADGEVVSELVCSVKQYDHVWFPETVCLFRWGSETPTKTIYVDHAQFDDPSLPASLSPEDIGIEVGTNVWYAQGNDPKLMGWDGERLEPFDVIAKKINDGTLTLGPGVKAQRRRARVMSEVFHNMGMPMKSLSAEFGLPYPNTRPQLWEEYVKRFIEHYKLNSDQQQKAWSIHKSCKERAENYLTKRKRDFERLQKDELDLQKMPETSDKRKTMTKVIKRRTELLEPITKIFENELKPRLQKLLTRRQLKEASSYKPKKGEE